MKTHKFVKATDEKEKKREKLKKSVVCANGTHLAIEPDAAFVLVPIGTGMARCVQRQEVLLVCLQQHRGTACH